MSFFLETTDMDLGDTPIENIFINDYMPMANGTYVKVYLLGYKYAHDKDAMIDVNNKTISKHLNIPLEDVLRSWDFWESKGIIKKIKLDEDSEINYNIKFLNLKQLYIRNNIGLLTQEDISEEIKDTESNTEEFLIKNKIPEINKMLNSIDYIMRRQMVPVEKQRISEWIDDYNMNPDVIEKAFFYGVERRGIRKLNYIEAIIRNWYDEGLTNMEALMESFKLKDEKYYRYQKVMKSLGLDKRPIKEDEMEHMDIWFEKYEFSLDLVLEACERDKNPTPSIRYVNGILQSWWKKGIREVSDIEIMDRPEKKKENKSKNTFQRNRGPKSTRFHNFEQRTDKYTSDQLEKIARRKRDSHTKRSKGEA
ncbi:MAG TPA: DnaD domain protein [Tissierellaceae bacterium]|nr:DnaD domain protein [Tissierellaceae bacterium]